MKKIALFIVLLCALTLLELYLVFNNIWIVATFSIHDFSEVWQAMMSGIVGLLKSLCLITVYCIVAIHIIRKTNFTNYTRLAYEEFKEKRIAKKENKRKAKIEKLQKQLNEIEKDA